MFGCAFGRSFGQGPVLRCFLRKSCLGFFNKIDNGMLEPLNKLKVWKKNKNVFFQCSVFQISVISVVGFFKFPWKKYSLGVGLFLMI